MGESSRLYRKDAMPASIAGILLTMLAWCGASMCLLSSSAPAYADEYPVSVEARSQVDFGVLDEIREQVVEKCREYLISEDDEYLIASSLDRVYMVDVDGGADYDGATVQLYEQSAEANQRWRFKEEKPGWYSIENVGSGKVLSIAGGTEQAKADIIQDTFTGAKVQLWKPTRNPNGSYTFESESGMVIAVPSTTVANKNKLWLNKRDDTARQDFVLKLAPNEEARGHWTYQSKTLNEMSIDTVYPAQGGDAIAAAAVALAGYAKTSTKAAPSPADKSGYTRPPNSGYGGNWTVYNQVTSVIPVKYHASCDDAMAIAVRYAGVDDAFPKHGSGACYDHMMASSKWTRVGGVGKYWHRNTSKEGGWGDEGVDIQPGDVLIREAVETQNHRGAHCCVYVGAEKSNMKYPGADLTYYEGSFENKYWPYMGRFDKYRGGGYCVFRRNGNDLDPSASKWADVCPDEKAKYAASLQSSINVTTTTTEVKEDYVYDDYAIEYKGLPEDCEFNGVRTYTYDCATLKLEDPEVPEDILFEGWYTQQEGGDRVTTIPSGSIGDVVLYAHTRELPLYEVEYGNIAEGYAAPGKTEFRENSAAFDIPDPEIVDDSWVLFDGWYTAENGGERVTEVAKGTVDDVQVFAHWKSKWLELPLVIVPIGAVALAMAALAVAMAKRRKRSQIKSWE